MASRIKGITVEIGIRYNKLRKFRKQKERHSLQTLVE